MIYGYCRISTPRQSIERQVRNIREAYGDGVKIYCEAYTGTTVSRPEFAKLLRQVAAGDTVVFDEVSRMSRNAEEGFALYEELYGKGVELVFLKEPYISTATFREAAAQAIPMTGGAVDIILEAVNRYLLEVARTQIRIAFEQAQKEVDDLHRRTREGIETARRNGKQIGRAPVGRGNGKTFETAKAKRAKEIIRRHSKSFGGTLNDTELQKLAGISRNTLYKYKGEIKGE